jgi:GntR family transcriptional repressor for pyruvate dehydrogenase complex
MAIEREIAAIASTNRTEEDLRNLEKILLRLERITDYRRYWIDKDLDYHMAIAEATNNRVLLQTMEVVVAPIKRKLWQSMNEEILETPTSVKELTKEHWAIFEAIKNKDPQQAVKAVEAHLQTVSKNLLSSPPDKNGLAL